MKKFNRTIIILVTVVIFLASVNTSYAFYDPSTGRFNRMDPFTGEKEQPRSLHKYVYCDNNPVNRIDPTGRFTTTELNVSTAIQVDIGASIAVNALLLQAYLDNKSYINTNAARQEIELFLLTNPQPFTQYQFEQLENRIRARTRSRKNELLYLFYGHQTHISSIYTGLRPPASLTRDVYPTGWLTKMRLAQYRGGPRDSVFFVIPDRRPIYGPYQVRGRPDQYMPGLWLPGRGYEYYVPNGTGPGSVLGHLPIPIGDVPSF